MMDSFKLTLFVMAFFSFSITIYSYAMPDEMRSYTDSWSNIAGQYDVQGINQKVEGSLQKQTSVPVIDVGALVFYSGNIILDLILNFVYAIPQMITLFFTGLMMMFGINTQIMNFIQIFLTVLMTIVYFLGLIELLINVRSGRLA